jgi:hypothetical protein
LYRQAGFREINARAAVLALVAGHPFRRWPIESAMALHGRIIETGLMTEVEFESTINDLQVIVDDPEIWMTSFIVTQVWGYKPQRA